MLGKFFPQCAPGITTWAEPGNAVYLRDNISGKTMQVGVYNGSIERSENRMAPLKDGFESFGVGVLEDCALAESCWITIDEIGYLESECEKYLAALKRLFEKKRVAAVVRKQELSFLRGICGRDDAFVLDMDDPFGNIGCVIMASGLGKRFGGNKLMADFNGEPMINRVLMATEGIFSRRVVVTRSGDVDSFCKSRGVETVLHELPNRNDTVLLGLKALEGTERCMFTPADQPLLRRDTVASLALASAVFSDKIWRTECNGVPGAPVVFPEWAFPCLKALPEGKGGSAVIKKHLDALKTVSVLNENELRDVDTPEDMKELLDVLQNGQR